MRQRRRAKRSCQMTVESCERRDLMSGQLAGSYFTGVDQTGPKLNVAIERGQGWIYNNGVLLNGSYGVSGELYYQGGGNIYSGTLAISGTAAKFTVSGPVGTGLMTWRGISGFINGHSGTLTMSFPVVPNGVSDYTISFDAPPHRPLPRFLGHR